MPDKMTIAEQQREENGDFRRDNTVVDNRWLRVETENQNEDVDSLGDEVLSPAALSELMPPPTQPERMIAAQQLADDSSVSGDGLTDEQINARIEADKILQQRIYDWKNLTEEEREGLEDPTTIDPFESDDPDAYGETNTEKWQREHDEHDKEKAKKRREAELKRHPERRTKEDEPEEKPEEKPSSMRGGPGTPEMVEEAGGKTEEKTPLGEEAIPEVVKEKLKETKNNTDPSEAEKTKDESEVAPNHDTNDSQENEDKISKDEEES